MFLRIVLFLSLCLTQCWGQNCDEKRIQIDETYARLIFIGTKLSEKLDARIICDQITADLKELENYKKQCLKQRPRQLTGIIISSYRRAVLDKYCKTNDTQKQTDLLESLSCINDMENCYLKMIDNIIGVRYLPDNLRIPHVCCDYHSFFECSKLKTMVSKKCTPNNREIGLNIIHEIFGKMAEWMCNEYTKGSQKCKAIGKTPKRKKGDTRTKSFFIPLIETLNQ